MDPNIFSLGTFVGPGVYDRGRLAHLLYLGFYILVDEDRENLFFGSGGELEGCSKDGEGSEPLVEGSGYWEGGNRDDGFIWVEGR